MLPAIVVPLLLNGLTRTTTFIFPPPPPPPPPPAPPPPPFVAIVMSLAGVYGMGEKKRICTRARCAKG